MTRVIIVDDHGVFRSGLRIAAHDSEAIDVIGDSPEYDPGGPTPDVLVLSEMSGRWGQLVTQALDTKSPPAVVLILDTPAATTLERARSLGVVSCVARGAAPEAFVRAIVHAARSRTPLADDATDGHRRISVEMLEAPPFDDDAYGPRGDDQNDRESALRSRGSKSPLGVRDIEILAAVASGFSNRQIGDRLGLSDQTVKNRLTSILRKVGAVDRTEAVVTAIRNGWLAMDAVRTSQEPPQADA